LPLPDLHAHSTFSPYDGLGSPESVVARAVALGWQAVCLTEHGHVMSAPALYNAAKAANIKPIIGCEMYVTPDESLIDGDKAVMKNTRHLTVLALSLEGYQNIVAWNDASMQRPSYYGKPRISLDGMAELAPWPLHHNVVLSGCLGGELCQCILHGNGHSDNAALLYLQSARDLFPNFYIELQNHRLTRLCDGTFTAYETMLEQEASVRDKLLKLAKLTKIPVIVTNDSHYQHFDQRKAHIAMLARKQHRRAAESHEQGTTESNRDSFVTQYVYWGNYLRSMEGIARTLPEWAEQQSLNSIQEIIDEADIRLDPLDEFSYAMPRSAYSDPVSEVRRRSKARLKSMVLRHGDDAQERFDYELGAMEEFAHYLLIYSDIVRMARSQGIYTWTRGSAANSLVCYCLGIHEIDPIHYKLLFERFVNPARAKFPDVDIDIEGHRRNDVARMITEYMEQIEGVGNVLPICTYTTVANRSAFRLMAEAAGVPKEQVDELSKLLPQMIDSGMVADEEQAYEVLKEELGIDIHADATAMFDAIGGVSQHACAFALGTSDRPLSSWVPTYRIGSSDALVTQYNMKYIEEMGFQKLDLLRLDTLSIMHSIARMVGKDIRWLDSIMQTAPGIYAEDDEATFKLIQSGRTEGIHTLQGGTQRRGGIEVGVASDFDMVAVQALYRPSGTRTGFDKAYCDRKHGKETYEPLNEIADLYLGETYGLPIYQEQIMALAFALGMSGEEVDDLYKAIKTAKGIGRGAAELFDRFRPVFMEHALRHMPRVEADQLWRLFDAFQGYGFNRGHASSYAILALKTAWLKAHYPQEFFIALLERYPDNPRYMAAAIANGFKFEPPDINTSSGGFSRGKDEKHIRIGLRRIKGVGPGAVGEIVRNQPFASIDDLTARTNARSVDKTVRENLAATGALSAFGIKGERDDSTDLRLLNFIPRRPKAFQDCIPKLQKRYGSWKFEGLVNGIDITEGKSFCAKLFWIPPEPTLVKKASAMGKFNAWLLTVVDVNGIPVDLTASEDKKPEVQMLKHFAEHMQGSVICAEGKIWLPFLRGGNTSFKFWGIAGANNGNPEMWHCTDDDAKKLVELHALKERRRNAK